MSRREEERAQHCKHCNHRRDEHQFGITVGCEGWDPGRYDREGVGWCLCPGFESAPVTVELTESERLVALMILEYSELSAALTTADRQAIKSLLKKLSREGK